MGYDVGSLPGARPAEGAAARALFARVMGLVAVTCGFAALGRVRRARPRDHASSSRGSARSAASSG